MKPRVVCFDLGGVVVRICRSFGEACARAGLPLRDADFMQSEAALEGRRALMHEYQLGVLSSERYFDQLAEATRGRYSADEVRRIHDAWLLDEYPGLPRLVEVLNAFPAITTACLSNTNERHWSDLADGSRGCFPTFSRLERRFASHLVGACKPDPDIYEYAERELGAEPEEILFFDDHVQNVEAARDRGWRAEHIDSERGPAEQMARHLVAHGVPV